MVSIQQLRGPILTHFLFFFPGGEMVRFGEATASIRPRAASLQVQGPSTPSTFGLQHPLEASEAAWRREDEVQKRGAASLQAPRPYLKFPGSA